jgi:maltooligosyltrehalose trehalohydrolase
MTRSPMLYQGQEWSGSCPFYYFADQEPALAAVVRRGREEFLAQFPGLAQPEVRQNLADPSDHETFERSKLDHAEREQGSHRQTLTLHRDLLRLRRQDPAFSTQRAGGLDGAVLGSDAFVLRFFGVVPTDDRLLLLNLGTDLQLDRVPEPLLAPPHGCRWQQRWTSEAPQYGGIGAAPPEDERGRWRLAGGVASVLAPVPAPRLAPLVKGAM